MKLPQLHIDAACTIQDLNGIDAADHPCSLTTVTLENIVLRLPRLLSD